ncbi:MAG: energy transducer TonB [Proteobacteria bacterium]|nr:energy transducer TonB [Pseudomonadota bacterium]
MWRLLNKTRLSGYFGLAILIHGVLLLCVLPTAQWIQPFSNFRDRAIEIISPEDLAKLQKPVVKTSQLKEKLPSQGSARFAGEFDQRVEHETQSPIKGQFQEGDVFKAKESPEIEGEGETRKAEEKSLKGYLTFGQSPNLLPKDIPYGNQTVLNTDKVRYASFINRIADEIYQPWVEAAERALQEYALGHRKMEPNIYITRLRVTLNSEGAVTGIQVMDSCGVSELDEAPKKAFWESEPFPNPPNQLFEKDGYVRLTYEFQFEWKSSGFNIIPWKI